MFTTSKISRATSLAKWLLLPLIVLLFTGFSLRKHEIPSGLLESTFVLMIDAGHGGSRTGVTAPDGTREKDLTLSIAKKIKELNKSDRIKILMTREGDEDTPLRDRVEHAKRLGANAFLSIHINSEQPSNSGIQIMMTKNASEYAEKSQLLGSLLSHELSKVFKVDGELKKGADKGVWVLDAPEINYPSLLIECGNLNNPHDLEFIKSDENQERIAAMILSAVNQFASGVVQAKPAALEILVEKGSIDFELRDKKVVKADFSKLKKGSMKNVFGDDDLKAFGSEVVIVDGIYLGNNSNSKHLHVDINEKLIIVSTNGIEPLASLKIRD